jgi:NAD(P)-dependent dehydrogenase (short-subunit alcohol dehydrogenase family)
MKEIGKYAIILGSSQRLGRSIALHLANHGYNIALHYHQDKTGALETQKMVEKRGVDSLLVQCDLFHIDTIKGLLQNVLSTFPYISTVVNCTSVFKAGRIEDIDENQFDSDQQLHQKSPFFLTKELYLYAKGANRHLSLTHLSDAHTRHPKASRPSYYIAKRALEEQVRILSVSVAPYVRINAVAPGLIIPNNEKEALYFAKREQEIPLQALASPTDIAFAVYFFAENRAVTGQTLIVDGGEWLL